MGQIMRCPLVGTPCMKPIDIRESSFFLAEPEKPSEDRQRRMTALNTALGDGYIVESALDEKGINAFTCKICEMIQACAYGIADIKGRNENVLFELGMMIALGKPTIILAKEDEELGLKLPSDLNAIEVIPFTDYIDILEPLRDILKKLPAPTQPLKAVDELDRINPKLAEELRKAGEEIVAQFKEVMTEAKLDMMKVGEEREAISPPLAGKLSGLDDKLEDLMRLGFVTDAKTAFMRGNYFYNKGKYEEALASYNLSLELSPEQPETLNNRGVTYDSMGKYEEALADYNRSLGLRTDDPDILMNRGVTYRYMGRYKEALADYNRSLKLSPADPVALYNRGTTYIHVGMYEEALADLKRSLEPRPDHPATLYNMACLFSLWEKTDEALDYLEKAIAGDEKYREKSKTDKDFSNIREDPRFKKLIEPE